MTKYIFVTGGVISSLGKGLASAALGAILQAKGFKIHIRKFDPYLNVDPGTMNPAQHGEVFVTDDGAETDLDLGHYERFTNISNNKDDSISSGRIYSDVIRKERKGDYLGMTVQVIPHITDRIKRAITYNVEKDLDFLICEVGGTVGDIEGLPFLEAIRQFTNEVGRENTMTILLTLVPYIKSAKELKTKPTQNAVKELLHIGIQPDILLCRCDRVMPESVKSKLSLFCNVKRERVIEALDVKTIYQVPICYSEHGLDVEVCKYFKVGAKKADLTSWHNIVNRINSPKNIITIAIVGKYVKFNDAYKSLIEAITHGSLESYSKVNIKWINAEELEKEKKCSFDMKSSADVKKILGNVNGILVPGGYGERGVVGKIAAIKFARENNIPFLGICFGMQVAVIEFARNVLKIKDANSTELDKTSDPVVDLVMKCQKENKTDQRNKSNNLGGTMRLGSCKINLASNSLVKSLYGKEEILERHRHRYEVNINYRELFESKGLKFSGMSFDGLLPEIVELDRHPWFVAVQFHPEFKSRPFSPHPIFTSFISAALDHLKNII